MSTSVYIDGFNFYYGCIKGTSFRWLNLETVCRLLLPQDNITAINYFTARVSATPTDPDKPVRQQIYLRALRTLPTVSVTYGHFLRHDKLMPLADPLQGGRLFALVTNTEEKGSDVNIASHLIRDACRNTFDVAVIITNDSDLVEPIKIVTGEFGKPVGVINPHQHPSKMLKRYATFFKQIRSGVLAASLFPPTLTDANGVFHKPHGW